ncbi:hypothetical protein JOB18_012900 [Solea senegalensis]|uniref:Secreted protein n=1 Tax=Solea senegalensis TaxID=28829 RepID=A0AAV6QH72_SOLSE|nr:hypothetical protein JOB18_012900 [Solea senegalensis]
MCLLGAVHISGCCSLFSVSLHPAQQIHQRSSFCRGDSWETETDSTRSQTSTETNLEINMNEARVSYRER